MKMPPVVGYGYFLESPNVKASAVHTSLFSFPTIWVYMYYPEEQEVVINLDPVYKIRVQ